MTVGALEALRDHLLQDVPASWLDPVLTGPDAVIGQPPYGCADIERVLRAVRQRLSDHLDALLRVPQPSTDRDLLIRADSYLSLLWHRHTPAHIKADVELAMQVERTIGELRKSYKEGGGSAPQPPER